MANGSSCFLLLASYFACKTKGNNSVYQAMYAYSQASQPMDLLSEDELSSTR